MTIRRRSWMAWLMAVLLPVTGLLADDTAVLVSILVRKGILTEEEAKAVVAFLKWMSSINTNGFPRNFTPIAQEGDQ